MRLLRYDDGTTAFQWGEAGDPYVFEQDDEDSTVIAFTKAVNDGIESGDDIEGEAAQAVAEVLKASGDVLWDGEAALNDWREDLCAQLPPSNYAMEGGKGNSYYYVDDVALDGSKVLICGMEGGDAKRWVAEVTEAGGEPVLAPRAQWVEVESQFVAKAGRKFSNAHFEAMRAAHDALGKLIAVGDAERTPKSDDEPATKASTDGLEMSYSVTKADSAMRYTLGPLYAPARKDAHGEYVDDEVLHKSLHEFVRDSADNGRRINLQHGDKGDLTVGEWVEAVRWPYEHTIKMVNAATGEEHDVEMPAGTVYLGVVWDEDYWDVEKNAPKGLNGYSLGGRAVKVRDDSETLKDMGYKVRKAASE